MGSSQRDAEDIKKQPFFKVSKKVIHKLISLYEDVGQLLETLILEINMRRCQTVMIIVFLIFERNYNNKFDYCDNIL